ncbi:MAG: hypothetical protein RSB70_06330 [Clostridium sp.]
MIDIQQIKDDEIVIVGVKSKDFLGNATLNEYEIKKSEKGFIVDFTKVGLRNQKYNGSIEVDKLITNIKSGDRNAQLINFICENSEIVAETCDREFKMKLKEVIYYKVIKQEIGDSDGAEV